MSETDKEAFAIGWLQPEPDAGWSWDEACEVVLWDDGSTLLFREELAQMIERLLPNKVPAKASLLFLLLAAAKGKLPDHAGLEPELLPALELLGGLAKWPTDLSTGVAAKAHLVEYFTESLPCLLVSQAKAVLSVLRGGLPILHLLPDISSPPLLATCLRQLEPALRKAEAKGMLLRLSIGLDVLPEAAEPEEVELETISARVAQLLNDLSRDAEYAGLVQMVKDLMAAISLPHALAPPEASALGGLSDISNRGPLHRLLTSELAHDHEMLAMRLALNEALYLKSEPPASNPLSELVLLIDSGIRLWGTPRVFAAATALALLAKVPKRQAALTFRARLTGATEADLTRKPGLTAHLAALEINEHPSASLQYLVQQFAPSQPVDLVVITHERGLGDPAFQIPKDLPDRVNLYLIAVNREGQISMYLSTPQGRRLLKQAKLDLSKLLPGRAAQVLDPHGRFPAIFAQEPFPFLLVPPDLLADLNFATANYNAGLSRTGTVWHWKSHKAGARQLKAPPIPGTPLMFAHDETAGCLVLLKYLSGELRLLRWFDEPQGTVDVTVIKDVPCGPKSTFRLNGLLYVLYLNQADVINLATGQVLARASLPSGLGKIGEGFYRRTGHGIGSLAWNGQTLAWEPLQIELAKVHPRLGKVLQVFRRQGLDGPWAIGETGNIVQTCPPYRHCHIDLTQATISQISPDGHSLKLKKAKGPDVTVSIKDEVPVTSPAWQRNVPAPHWSIRVNFTHIACDASGHIVLRSRKGRWIRIQLNALRDAFAFSQIEGGSPAAYHAVFKPIPSPAETDLNLSEAIWPGTGSRAVLDRRGLLHLQSGTASLPEVSILLAESNSLPVWSSDGTAIGPSFFVVNSGQSADAVRLDGIIRAFIGEVQ